MKRWLLWMMVTTFVLPAGGCGAARSYDNFSVPEQEAHTLVPVGNLTTGNSYAGVAATAEPTEAVYTSKDGRCRIEAKAHYYDVTLDLTDGGHYAAGAAYGEVLRQLPFSYEEQLEQYLYDSFGLLYGTLEESVRYDVILERTRTIKAALAEPYRQEMDGFSAQFSGGDTGLVRDGRISSDEADLLHLIPDVLRETACSAITVDGSRTASGKRLTARLLEWDLGKENSMADAHCVLHLQQGEQSLISVTSLGLLDVITGVNDDGVFAGILDVGSAHAEYDSAGKISYTYAMREGLEACKTAKEFGDFMVAHAPDFPYNHNVIITDENDAFVAEDCHVSSEGRPLLRDRSTPLLDGLQWNAEGCLCTVNAFAAKGQYDCMTRIKSNAIRWLKYDRLFSGSDFISQERFKELLTSEQTNNHFTKIRGSGLVFMLLADYETRSLQAVFTGKEGVTDYPEFLDLGVF